MKLFAILFCVLLCTLTLLIDTSTAQVYPVEGDCSKYKQCDGSGCFILSCGRGTEFNPAIGTCDYPLADRQGCNNRG